MHASNNEVLAREGIDTMWQSSRRAYRLIRNNEVLAREGIDTFNYQFIYIIR